MATAGVFTVLGQFENSHKTSLLKIRGTYMCIYVTMLCTGQLRNRRIYVTLIGYVYHDAISC